MNAPTDDNNATIADAKKGTIPASQNIVPEKALKNILNE